MLEAILKLLDKECIINSYEILNDNEINIIVYNTLYKFKQEEKTFTLTIEELENF